MARATKTPATWDSIFFSTPEQKVLRYLLSSRDTSYSLRVLVSKLKGVRGLGGIQGLEKILTSLEEANLVSFIDNRRGIRIQDEHPANVIARRLWGLCEIESLHLQLQQISSKGVLTNTNPGEIELYVVSDQPDEIRKITEQHPRVNSFTHDPGARRIRIVAKKIRRCSRAFTRRADLGEQLVNELRGFGEFGFRQDPSSQAIVM